jgi:NAD(P)-dependent dehydrogenase (short-subunit alcohol dehydrogenase family)
MTEHRDSPYQGTAGLVHTGGAGIGGELRFDEKVAIVTGAARGIGRAHAQLLARRGAKVILNDSGVTMSGSGHDPNPLRLTTEGIREAGHVAVADHSDAASFAGAQNLLHHALDQFGRIDIVVNNAGIYAMDEFPDVEFDELQRQFDVHVGSGFFLTKACWPHMVEAGYGRVVFTTSTGSLGVRHLTAYGTAKAAVFGLARALAAAAVETGLDIKVNALAPMATTRMSESQKLKGADPEPDPETDPRLVSPMLALLVHETCPVNGETYMSGMRRYSKLLIAETAGYVHSNLDVTPETLMEHWDLVTEPTSHREVTNTAHWSDGHKRAIQATPIGT